MDLTNRAHVVAAEKILCIVVPQRGRGPDGGSMRQPIFGSIACLTAIKKEPTPAAFRSSSTLMAGRLAGPVRRRM